MMALLCVASPGIDDDKNSPADCAQDDLRRDTIDTMVLSNICKKDAEPNIYAHEKITMKGRLPFLQENFR
jgi:hypothetical protein